VDPEMMDIVEKYQNYSLEKGFPTKTDIKIMSDVNSKVSLRLIQSLLNNSAIAHEIIEKFMFDGDLDNSEWIVDQTINYCDKSIENVISILYFHGAITVDSAKNQMIKTKSDQSSKFQICLPKSTSFKLFIKYWKKISR